MSEKQKKNLPFVRKEAKLPDNHGWRGTPGYKICVIQRGDMRFEYPEAWVVVPKEGSIKLHDKPYPNDSMVLEISVFRTPPMDWNKFPPLDQLICDGVRKNGHLVTLDQVQRLEIPGLFLAWVEYPDIDSETGKDVIWRQAHCRPGPLYSGPGLLGLLTFCFYKEIYDKGDAEWNHIIGSIIMGEYIADPLVGPRLN